MKTQKNDLKRRDFLKMAGLAVTGANAGIARADHHKSTFHISLAEWSLHRHIRDEKKITNLDFPKVAKAEFGIDAVEYVNQFFKDKAQDRRYLQELRLICEGEGVKSLLIMVDGEGALGDADAGKRTRAIENHYKWAAAARFLGCHSIRVNADAGEEGSYEDRMERAADGLRRLSEYVSRYRINVIVENHGGLSSNGAWLAGVMKKVNMDNCGTLPDFGNFRIGPGENYDRYKGVKELMPFAKAVSAKSHDFDDSGNEIHTDYEKMMRIVLEAGYKGHVGIEYEGDKIGEYEGIKLTKTLLERVREKLA